MNLRPTKPPMHRPAGSLQPPATPEPPSGLRASLVDAREHVDVVVGNTKIRGRMRLLSRAETMGVRVDTQKHLAEVGMPDNPRSLARGGLHEEWSLEIAVRTLAVAMRDPDSISQPLSIIDEWRDCDEGQIVALWSRYQDLREQLDTRPIEPLSSKEVSELDAAVKGGDVDVVGSFGLRRLAAYIAQRAAVAASTDG